MIETLTQKEITEIVVDWLSTHGRLPLLKDIQKVDGRYKITWAVFFGEEPMLQITTKETIL